MTGETLDYKRDLCLKTGEYCQVHEDELPRNSQKARTQGAIVLGPTGNLQGGFKFINLKTGKGITRYSWDRIPITDTVINRVNELGHGEPELFIFTNRQGNLIGDIDISESHDPAGVDDGNYAPQNDSDIIIYDIDLNDSTDGNNNQESEEPEPQHRDPSVPSLTDTDQVDFDPPEQEQPAATMPPADTGTQEQIPGVQKSTRVRGKPKDYIPSMRGKAYDVAAAQFESGETLHPDAHMLYQDEFYQSTPDEVAAIMTQLSLKAGLREWGKRAESAVTAEMKQLHFCDTFKPVHWHELTDEQKKMVLPSHLFLKEKRSGKIKGRTVAGGNLQRDYPRKMQAHQLLLPRPYY